jgi:hypothetical protein
MHGLDWLLAAAFHLRRHESMQAGLSVVLLLLLAPVAYVRWPLVSGKHGFCWGMVMSISRLPALAKGARPPKRASESSLLVAWEARVEPTAVKHLALRPFWKHYRRLPQEVQELVRSDCPHDPSGTNSSHQPSPVR